MGKQSFCFVIVILVLFQLMDSTMADEGTCANMANYPGVTTLNLEKYMGCWYYYGVAFINQAKKPGRLDCKTVHLAINTSKKDTFESIFKGIQGNEITTITGQATKATTGFLPGNFDVERGGHYNIIDTDYDNYAIAYHCAPNGGEMIYAMGRKKRSLEMFAKVFNKLMDLGIDSDGIIWDQQNWAAQSCKAPLGENFCL